MPPKVVGAADASSDPAITILINLIRTATKFQVDNKAFAELSGIKDAKNAPRKYNGVLRRHGIKIEGGEVITLDSIAEDINDIDGKEPKTPDTAAKIASKTPNSKMPKTPASKKRKAKAKKEEEEEPETPTIKTELNEVDKLLLEERSEDEAE